jgi:hypothetical protein
MTIVIMVFVRLSVDRLRILTWSKSKSIKNQARNRLKTESPLRMSFQLLRLE